MKDSFWVPQSVRFAEESWVELLGDSPKACVVDDRDNIVAVVWSPNDDIPDTVYAAALSNLPKLTRYVRKLVDNPSDKENKERLLKIIVALESL